VSALGVRYPRVACEQCGRMIAAPQMTRHLETHELPLADRTIVPERERHAILEEYARGASMQQIADAHYYALSTIARLLHANAARIRPQGGQQRGRTLLSAEVQLRTAQLAGMGFSLREIAASMGCAPSTVHYRLARSGVRSTARRSS
jgi:DNA-binding NarL/FixJ family response regulator